MNTLKYVMVSVWDNWPTDNSNSCYSNRLIQCRITKDKVNIETLFINAKMKRAWLGFVQYEEEKEGKTYYSLKVEGETIIPEEFKTQGIGWYIYSDDIQKNQLIQNSLFEPPFFERLRKTKDPNVFEDDVYYLLRLLGIQDIKKYPQSKQAGRCDGEFIFGKIAVKYDATLNKNYAVDKGEQI